MGPMAPMPMRRRLRWRTQCLVTVLVTGAVGLSACGSSSSSSRFGGGASASPPSGVQFGDLSAYKRRCAEMSKRGAWANVVYRRNQEMTRGDTATVTAAVTLNLKAPASEVLGSQGSVAGPPVLVSCVISARLTASPYDISVNDSRWEPRSFETVNTAHWIWYVGPKIGGTQTLGLFLQPVVQVGRPSQDYSTYVSADSTNTAYYPITAHISVPLSERIPELMSRFAATLKVAQGLVEAMSGLIAALIALAAALGIKRIRNRRTQGPTPPHGSPASAS